MYLCGIKKTTRTNLDQNTLRATSPKKTINFISTFILGYELSILQFEI